MGKKIKKGTGRRESTEMGNVRVENKGRKEKGQRQDIREGAEMKEYERKERK